MLFKKILAVSLLTALTLSMVNFTEAQFAPSYLSTGNRDLSYTRERFATDPAARTGMQTRMGMGRELGVNPVNRTEMRERTGFRQRELGVKTGR